VLGASVASGGLYSCGVEPYWLETVRLEIVLPGLDPAFDGYTIAQLSDLHVGSGVPLPYLRRAIDLANEARPDLVAVTGDIVDACGWGGAAEEAAALLSELRPRDRTLAVLGNHDTGAFAPDRPVEDEALRHLRGALAEANVDVLVNENRMLEHDGGRLRVSGFGDPWSRQFDARAFHPRPGEATLVLSHNPDTAPELAERGAGLVLAGHTHGGQVRLPFFGPPYVPVERKDLLHGHYRLGRTQLYVNPGLGYSYGIRLLARPELTFFRLAAARAGRPL